MYKPDFKNFKLKSIKYSKKVVTVSFDEERIIGDESFEESTSNKRLTVNPTEDLIKPLYKLYFYLAEVNGLLLFSRIFDEEKLNGQKKMATKQLGSEIEQFKNDVLNRVKSNQLLIKYDKDGNTKEIKIKGTLDVFKSNKKVDIESPWINLSQTIYGNEEDIEHLVDVIKTETYEYLFDDKISDKELDFNVG